MVWVELLGGSFFCCNKPFPRRQHGGLFLVPEKSWKHPIVFFLNNSISMSLYCLLVLAMFEDWFEFSRFFFQRNTTVYKKDRIK